MASAVKHSFSALSTFLECERKLYYQRVLRLPEAPSHYLSIGNLYHAAIASALQNGATALDAVLADCKHRAGEAWAQDVTDQELFKEVSYALTVLQKEVFPYLKPRAVEAWANKINPATKYVAKIDVYSEWTPIVEQAGMITGKLEEPCVIDWKTIFSAKRARSQGDVDQAAQLAQYCLAVGCRNAGFVEIRRDGYVRTVMTTFSEYDLKRWSRYLETQYTALDTRSTDPAAFKLAPPGHPLCCPKWCQYWRRCPGGEGA